MTDIVITPASGNIQFYNTTNTTVIGSIRTTSSNNIIISASGGVQYGNTLSDVFIGDGVNTINIQYQLSGAIRAVSGNTLTIGSSNSFVIIDSNTVVSRTLSATNVTVSANLTVGAAGELVITPGAGIYANGSLGTANQVLTSNGSSIYWANGSSGGGSTYVNQSFTGNGSTTSFTVTGGYTPNNLDVYINGVRQSSLDVTTSSGTAIVFNVAPINGTLIDVVGIVAGTMNYATVNTSAGYTWTNTHTFSNTITFNSTINGTANNSNFLSGNSAADLRSYRDSLLPSGTVMLFVQTSAPTGWTKSTTHNDKALRVVSGTVSSGGSTSFSSAFASRTPQGTVSGGTVSSYTLTSPSDIPSHAHVEQLQGSTAGATTGTFIMGSTAAGGTLRSAAQSTATTGSGGGHSHGFTQPTFTGTSMDFAVNYVDVIIATKD